jgi:hypothetical protein
VDFRKLNVVTKKNPYPLPFTNEVFNIIASHKTYSFLDGFFGYHWVFITVENQYKIVFIID